MRPSQKLARLDRAARGRLKDLRARVRDVTPSSVASSYRRRALGLVCIELVDLWAAFSRSFFVSSVFGTRTGQGVQIRAALSVGSWDAVLVVVGTALYPNNPPPPAKSWTRREEPAWHDPSVLQRACTAMKCSNKPTVDAALSIGTRAFQDAATFRNFFAHRHEDTRAAAVNVALANSVAPARHPADMVVAVPASKSLPLVLEWIDDMDAVIELLCE